MEFQAADYIQAGTGSVAGSRSAGRTVEAADTLAAVAAAVDIHPAVGSPAVAAEGNHPAVVEDNLPAVGTRPAEVAVGIAGLVDRTGSAVLAVDRKDPAEGYRSVRFGSAAHRMVKAFGKGCLT